MTKEQAIEHVCATVALAYRSIGDYSRPSDGFCAHCAKLQGPEWHYQNEGHVLHYVREAVREKLLKDGYKIIAGNEESEEKA